MIIILETQSMPVFRHQNKDKTSFITTLTLWYVEEGRAIKKQAESRSYCCGADCFSGSFINKPSLSRVRIGSIVRSGARTITSVVFLVAI